MEWLGLSPAPCGSVCTSQSPFPSAATSKFAGTLSLFTIFPSQTIASGQAWWRGCVIHLKVPVGLFLGTKSTGTESFWSSTPHEPPSLSCTFPKRQMSRKFSPALRWHCHTLFKEQWTTPQCKGAGCGLSQDFRNYWQMYSPGSAELQEEIISIPVPTGKIIMGRPPEYSRLSDQAAPLLILISGF